MSKEPGDIAEEADENCVYIGKKPTKGYVFAVQTQAQKQIEIRIKARGRNISKAVDVSQIALDRFLEGWILKGVSIGTEIRPAREEDETDTEPRPERVSFIEIVINKK